MIRTLLAVAIAVQVAMWLAPARAQLSQDVLAGAMECERAPHPITRIDGCTVVIDSGQLNGHPDLLSKVYNNRAIAFRELGRFDRAITDYDAAIQLDPGYAAAYHNRALAYGRLDQYERAIVDFNRALQLEPGRAGAYKDRGLAHCRLGNVDAASADWVRFTEIGGQSAGASLQEFLAQRGYHAGPIDGIVGPATLQALRAYLGTGCA